MCIRDSPNAVPWHSGVSHWDSNDTSAVVWAPGTNEILFISHLHWWIPNTFDMRAGGNRQIRIQSVQDAAPSIGSVNFLMRHENMVLGALDQDSIHLSGTVVAGVMSLNPAVALYDNSNDYLTVRYEYSNNLEDDNGLLGGNIRFSAQGWILLEANF